MKNLITTGLNVELNDSSQVYLGKWCLSKFSLETIENNKTNILDYHWNIKNKFTQDSKFILQVYEAYIIKLSNALNDFHNKNEPLDYWETLIGEWFLNFVSVMYDRWELINPKAVNKFNIQILENNEINVPEVPGESLYNYNSHIWNQYIFDKVIEFRKIKKVNKFKLENLKDFSQAQYKHEYNLGSVIFNNFKKKSELFIFRSNFGILSELFISIKKNKKATINFLPKLKINSENNITTRNRNLNLSLNPKDNFEIFLNQMINVFIPKVFIENYKEINRFVDMNMPNYSRHVVTSNAQVDHIPFMFWLAKNKKNIENFTILQNGGNIGSAEVQCQEYLDQKISDTYITWGWGDNRKNIKSLGSSKIIKLQKKYKYKPTNRKEILIVVTNGPRYHDTLISQTHGPQYIDEMYKIVKLCQSINGDDNKNLMLRLNPKDFGWQMREKINKTLPKVKIDKEKNFYKSIIKKKLLVFNYNGTSFLEALSLNIPSLILFNPDIWHIRESEKEYFKLLSEVGILHTNHVTICESIEKRSKNINIWWQQELLQENIKIFCDRFIKYDKDLISKIL